MEVTAEEFKRCDLVKVTGVSIVLLHRSWQRSLRESRRKAGSGSSLIWPM
jgi:hypothetical protein